MCSMSTPASRARRSAAAARTDERGGKNGEEDSSHGNLRIPPRGAPLTFERSTEPPIGGDAPRPCVAVDAGPRIGKSLSGKKGESVRILKGGAVVAVAAAAALTFVAVAAANPSKVLASDACSPSFNDSSAGPTTCSRNRGTPVGVFLQQLQRNGFAGAWHFSPKQVNVDAGDSRPWRTAARDAHLQRGVAFRGRRYRSPTERDPLRHAEPTKLLSSQTPPVSPPTSSRRGTVTIGPNTLTPGTPVHVRDPPVDGGHGRRPLTGDDTPTPQATRPPSSFVRGSSRTSMPRASFRRRGQRSRPASCGLRLSSKAGISPPSPASPAPWTNTQRLVNRANRPRFREASDSLASEPRGAWSSSRARVSRGCFRLALPGGGIGSQRGLAGGERPRLWRPRRSRWCLRAVGSA